MRLRERGDTIVEVLIAMAVVSLLLAGAYVLTTRNTATTEDTQEHSQALELAQAQLEYLHNAGKTTTNNNCFDPTAGTEVTGAANITSQCVVTPNGAGTQPKYTLRIVQPSTPPTNPDTAYLVTVTWPAVNNSGNDQVSLKYRTSQ